MSEYRMINGELYHHGIKGQKWGVRRYQNPDGTLTPAGKKRKQKEELRADVKAYSKASAFRGRTARTTDGVEVHITEKQDFINDLTTRKGEEYTRKVVQKHGEQAVAIWTATMVGGTALAAASVFVVDKLSKR